MAIRFSWDPEKARATVRKHVIAFPEAVTVFIGPLARIHDDPAHSVAEHREIIVGHSIQGRLLVVSFTERDRSIRIISARRTTPHERKDYEKSKES